MDQKKVKDSRLIRSQVMLPQDTNPAGNVHGGSIMKFIDNAAASVAIRHTRDNAVTASVDRIDFHHPVYLGNILTLKASLNMVGTTSMVVGVRVESENPYSGKVNHTASAYLTFVSLDKNSLPQEIPGVALETEDDKRRNRAAKSRRMFRLEEKRKEKECKQDADSCEL